MHFPVVKRHKHKWLILKSCISFPALDTKLYAAVCV